MKLVICRSFQNKLGPFLTEVEDRRGLQMWSVAVNILNEYLSRGQPTRGGPPVKKT